MYRNNKGLLIVLSGASGTGKGTVIGELLKRSNRFRLSISATTREPRSREKNGIDYFFIKKEDFVKKVKNSEFLEYAEYCENFYGTPKTNVFDMLDKGNDVLLEIEVEGGAQIKKKCPNAISIFIIPPSIDELKERLNKRGTDNDVVIKKRLNQAEREIKCAKEYDYIVVNDSLERCVESILKIVEVGKMRANRSAYIIDEVLKK